MTSDHREARRRRGDWWFSHLGAPIAAQLLRLLARTLRVRFEGEEHFRQSLTIDHPVVYTFWHEDLFAIASFYLRAVRPLPEARRVAVMVSRSRDGEKLAQCITRIGLEPVRGSSSRGAVAGLVQMARWVRGRDGSRPRFAAIALDGPRGPRHVAKPGAVLLARRAQAWVLPVTFSFSREWRFRSWDRTRLAEPGATMICRFHPLIAPEDADAEALQAILRAMTGD